MAAQLSGSRGESGEGWTEKMILRSARPRGMALGVVLAILLIVMTITFSVSDSAVVTMSLSNNERSMSMAKYAAEAGASQAFAAIKTTTTWSAGYSNVSMNHVSATYTVTVWNNSAGSSNVTASDGTVVAPSYVYLISTGKANGASRTTSLMIYVNAPQGPFQNALESTGNTTVSGGGLVDSYNSSNGPYSSGGMSGNIASGGSTTISGGSTIDGLVSSQSTVTNSATINGNVAAVGGITNSGTITGSTTATPTPLPSPSPVSCTYSSSNSNSTISASPSNAFSIDSSHNYKQTGGTVTLGAGSYYFNDFKVSGGGSIVISSGPVKIYCTGKIDFTGGSATNSTSVASNCQIYDSYTGGDGVKLTGGSTDYFTVYAPNTSVKLTGGSHFYGAVVAQTVDATGGTNIHYDVALQTLQIGTSGSTSISLTSWNRH